MAGLVLEFLHSQDQAINLQIIPGVPALCATAALLGAPLMHDFASISLSDRLTPWQTITTRLQMAAEGDFVITIYNPKSRGRQWQLTEAREILLRYRDRSTPVGIVRNAYRKDQKITITDLAHMLDFEVDMFTTIVIGNASTFISGNWIVTPRGYQTKYKLNSEL
jgi:precorrin-3B C17-methyltransferase